ncbi:MAG: ParB N-terminal domain-containing protein [Leptospira sp.]|nr:ParB N-terminal domain-containing protein [Leptospira sp.]
MEEVNEKIKNKAKDWVEDQKKNKRPGSLHNQTSQKTYIPKGVSLSPIVKMVSPKELKFNPLNDFAKLPEKEYEELKEDISRNGILDALTVKKDNVIVTGENRLRIALELLEENNEKVKFIPVRYYMNELSQDEEYDILEGDNLYRRHLTPEERKERLKARIKRKYREDLSTDNRGGDRKRKPELERREVDLGISPKFPSFQEESKQAGSKYQGDILIESGSKSGEEGSKIHPESLISEGSGSNYQGDSLKKNEPKKEEGEKKSDLAKKISEEENIPLGTARRYVTEIKKEIRSKEKEKLPKEEKPKSSAPKKSAQALRKEKVKLFQKKFATLTESAKQTEVNRLVARLIQVRKKTEKLEMAIRELNQKDAEIAEKLTAVGEKKRVHNLSI